MKKYKKILKIALNVFIWIFVVFSLVMTVLALAAQSNADGVPSLGGKCFLTVSSDSMAPTFNRNDMLIGEMLDNDQKMSLQPGEVITFHADLDGNGSMELNSHRIVSINYDAEGAVESYVTKGDNEKTNMSADEEPVKWQFVIAKWSGKKVAAIGGFISFLQQPKGFLITIVFPLIVFFLYELYVFIKSLLSIKAKKAEEAPKLTAQEEEEIKRKAIEEYLKQQQQKEENAPEPIAAQQSVENVEEPVADSAENE